MKTGIQVGDLMTRSFIYVSPDTDLQKCAHTMVKKRVGSLIIKKSDKLEGILTEKDILWVIVKKSKNDLKDILAKDLMKRKVVTIKPSCDILDAIDKMKKFKVRRLPVVENGKVIGMLTMKDILKVDPGLFELISETVKIKEKSKKIERGEKIRTKKRYGICEDCGETGMLYRDDLGWICEDCYSSK